MPPVSNRKAAARRPLWIGGSVLLMLGVAAYFLVPALEAVAHWLVLAGAMLLLLWFFVRRAASAAPGDRRDPTLFPQSTMLGDSADKEREG